MNIQFTAGNELLSASKSGLLRWNVETGERELLYEGLMEPRLQPQPTAAGCSWGEVEGQRSRALQLTPQSRLRGCDTPRQFGDNVIKVAIDPEGTFAVTGDMDGEVRVGPLTGEDPHMLLGHASMVTALAIDPMGRWIASGDYDGNVRLWPMPDLCKRPLHTLPREELIAKLKTLTNLRVVRDEASPTGWKLTHAPFPGWGKIPEW